MSPRLTDWSIACAAALALITGVISLVMGRLEDWFVFALHGAIGIWLLLLLLVTLALGSGIWWVGGGEWYFADFNLLNWHIVLGFVLTMAIIIHMLARA